MIDFRSQLDLLRGFALGTVQQLLKRLEIPGPDFGNPQVPDLFSQGQAFFVRPRELLDQQVSDPPGPRPARAAGVTGFELGRNIREGHGSSRTVSECGCLAGKARVRTQ